MLADTQSKPCRLSLRASALALAIGLWSSVAGAQDIRHLMGYGQSLSLGIEGVPVLTTEQPYGNLQFNTGIRVSPEPYTSFAPLAETRDRARGETGIAAAANEFAADFPRYGGTLNFVLLGSSAGRSGQSLQALGRGGQNLRELLRMVSSAREIAGAARKSYAYMATLWTQGETDQAAGISSAAYSAALRAIVADIDRSVVEITRQSLPIRTLTYQPASHLTYHGRKNAPWFPAVALALRETPGVQCVVPMYFGDFRDGVHADNETYRQLGKYYGRALAKLAAGRAPVALDAREISHTRGALRVRFAVPRGPLVLDTAWVAPAPNSGFDLWTADLRRQDIIGGVRIVSADTVEIGLTREPDPGSLLTYGAGRPDGEPTAGRRAGARGNLRDSEGDVDSYADAHGVRRRLDNWALVFALRVPAGS